MNKRYASKYFLFLLLALMAALSLTSVASAQQIGLPRAQGTAALTPQSAAKIASQSVRLPDGRVQVIVTLSANPAAISFINVGGRSNNTAARAAAIAQKAVVTQEQAAFAAQAGSIGAKVASSTWFVANSVTVVVHPSQLSALSKLAGVQRVDPDYIVYRDDTVSVPFIGADEVWNGFGGTGYTGKDVIVAVIDSGIDYIHTDFGGSGDYADNPDTTDGTDSTFFPAAYPIVNAGDPKVIGGTDYVGDDYDSTGENGSPVPDPDDDPIDCSIEGGGGHGTHVSGTAAGWGVNEDGTTYTGPFDNTLFTAYPAWTSAFRIGPGVAPEAALVALRVFGCDGSTSTSMVANAIDDAVSGAQANGLQADVINMSLGSPFGTQDPGFIENVAIKNASDAGTVVVMSAGNNGDIFFVTGSPGAANEGIAVASAVDPGNQARGVELNDLSVPEDTVFAAAYGASSPFIHEPVTAVFERPAPNPNGCTAADFATFTAGHIALIDRGTCNFSLKQDNAFTAGAAGVVVANVSTSLDPNSLVTMAAATVEGYNIPTVHVALTAGDALRAAADGTNTITMDWTLASFLVEAEDTLSSFSSRGIADNSQGSFKPDLAAPGQSILSAGSGTGEFTYNISGTSMASPHIAGSMALLKEKYPEWSVADLKALIMDTATNPVDNGVSTYSPQRVGTGRVDLVDAFTGGEVLAYNTENPAGVSVNFGSVEVVAGATLNVSKTITLKNLTGTQVDYDVTFSQGTDMTGVDLDVTEATVSVPANGTATVTVNLTGDPNVAGVNINSDPTVSTAGSRNYLTEESGLVVFTPTAGSTVPLSVGVYAAPRVNSAMAGALPVEQISEPQGATTIDLTGTGVLTGIDPVEDIASVVTPYELIASDTNEVDTPDNADLQYFGISSDYVTADPGDGAVTFAFATYGDWNTPNTVTFNVFIDFDLDGVADFRIFNDTFTNLLDTFSVEFEDIHNVLGGGAGAVYGYNTPLNGVFFDEGNTYLFNNNVMFMPIFMEDLLNGLGGPGFNYWVETYSSRFYDPVTDEYYLADSVGSASNPLYYNPEAPTYLFDAPVYLDADGESIQVAYDFSNADAASVPGILLLHHHNDAATGRAQVLTPSVLIPGEFTLVSPENNAVITDPAAVTAITWTPAADAVTYDFTLIKISNNADVSTLSNRLNAGGVLTLSDLTAAADDDGLTCDVALCTLTVDALTQAELTDGTYAWTVFANGAFDTEASNAAFLFKVNTGDIEMVVNGGFETAGAKPSDAATWALKNKSADKRLVDVAQANSGEASFRFKGKAGENAKLIQKLEENAAFQNVGITAGDVLTVGTFVNTTIAAPGKLILKISYSEADAGANGDGKDKVTLDLAATSGYQLVAQDFTSDGTVVKAKLQITFKSTSGKMWVDDVSVVRAGLNATLTGRGGADALPLPGPSSLSGRK